MNLIPKKLCPIQFLSSCYQLHCLVEMGGDLFQLSCRWRSSPRHYFLNLIDRRCPWKHGLSIEHLSNETAQCPYIDRLAIILAAEEQLGCPVPSGRDIIGHNNSFLVIGLLHEPNQAKIT
jgi:hypothetical protein